MLELWSGVLSNNAAKVRIALAEKGLDYVVNEVPWTKQSRWDPKPAGLLAVSPRGQVPVLIDDGFVVHDSTVIIEYLEDKYPTPPLFPAAINDKTECRMWEDDADYAQQFVGTLISDVFLGKSDAPLSEKAVDAIASLEQFYNRLETRLEDRDFLSGEFSAADVANFMVVAFATTMGAEVTQPRLAAWFARMLERPTVKQEYDAILGAAAAL